MAGITRYEVTFVVRNDDGSVDHKWTATWWAESYGHVEKIAYEQLAENKDKDSKIERIELW